eukprot:TRINITY_DN13388_c0_g1_i2.p1 TRINITY_DN13388_c0_g1~~TRINITY_DN13388_c0_g1_i2.p1  ORF type:complete len:130 (+),score=5.09 TRINITY_DN13388_c0_g1_i2:67-456(+)
MCIRDSYSDAYKENMMNEQLNRSIPQELFSLENNSIKKLFLAEHNSPLRTNKSKSPTKIARQRVCKMKSRESTENRSVKGMSRLQKIEERLRASFTKSCLPYTTYILYLIHICRCRRYAVCRSRRSPKQ